jgi:alpha-D-ribose 1-methylphosphonate 5-triphosphate synthase subunit PhnI
LSAPFSKPLKLYGLRARRRFSVLYWQLPRGQLR